MSDSPRSPDAVLQACDLAVGYRGSALLPPISLEVERGQLWALVGPNGCGKTTFLRTLLGLQPAVSGHVHGGARLAYVAQRTAIDLRLAGRVRDVVQSGDDRGWSFLRRRRSARSAAHRALARVNATELAGERYATLSEGQKQRVLVARALISEPTLLALDEPTSAMDSEAERAIMALLDEVRADSGVAMIMVSHHLPVVAQHASHLIVLDRDAQQVVVGETARAGFDPRVTRRYGALFSCCVPQEPPRG